MKVVLPIHKFTEPPFTQDKFIKLTINGTEKEFFCKVIQPTNQSGAFTYILPEGFPKSLVKVIFGSEVIVDGGGNEDKKGLSIYRNKRGRSESKKKALESKGKKGITLSF